MDLINNGEDSSRESEPADPPEKEGFRARSRESESVDPPGRKVVRTRSSTRKESDKTTTANFNDFKEEDKCTTNTTGVNNADDDSGRTTNSTDTGGKEDVYDKYNRPPRNRIQRRKLDSLYRKWNKQLPRGMVELGTLDLRSTP